MSRRSRERLLGVLYRLVSLSWLSSTPAASASSFSSVSPSADAVIANCIEMLFHPTPGLIVTPCRMPSKVVGHCPSYFLSWSVPAFFVRCFATAFSTLSLDVAYRRARLWLRVGGSSANGGLGLVQISAYFSGVISIASSMLICTLYCPLSSLFTLGQRQLLPLPFEYIRVSRVSTYKLWAISR